MSETMADENKKTLPNGEWLYIKGLHVGTKPEHLAAYLHRHGLPITPDCISIKTFGKWGHALVVVQSHVVLSLFQRALKDAPPFGPRQFYSEVAQHKSKEKAATAAKAA
jgi:hypothetical protein